MYWSRAGWRRTNLMWKGKARCTWLSSSLHSTYPINTHTTYSARRPNFTRPVSVKQPLKILIHQSAQTNSLSQLAKWRRLIPLSCDLGTPPARMASWIELPLSRKRNSICKSLKEIDSTVPSVDSTKKGTLGVGDSCVGGDLENVFTA